jgi:hypothetical protein
MGAHQSAYFITEGEGFEAFNTGARSSRTSGGTIDRLGEGAGRKVVQNHSTGEGGALSQFGIGGPHGEKPV